MKLGLLYILHDIDGGDILIQQSLPIEFDDDTNHYLPRWTGWLWNYLKRFGKRENWNNMFYPQEGVSSYHSQMILIPCSIWTSRNCLPLS